MNHILHIRVRVYVLEICFGQWDSNSVCLGAIWLLWSICVKSRYTAIKQTSGNTAYQHAKTQWRNSVGNIIACGMNPKRYHMCIEESGRKKYAAEESVTGEFPSQRSETRSFDVFFILRLNERLINNRDAGDLRRHRANYDVTVMYYP